MLYFGTECSRFKKEIKYAAQSLFRIMNLNWKWMELSEIRKVKKDDLLIVYGDDFKRMRYSELPCQVLGIKNSNQLFGEAFGKKESMPVQPLISKEFVSLYRDTDIINDWDIEVLHYDIIADVFFMLSRYEEYIEINPVKRDNFGRFCGRESIAYRFAFLDRPIVDEWALYIKNYILKSGCEYSLQVAGRKAKLLVTHDVDSLCRYSDWSDVLIGIQKKEIRPVEAILGRNPHDNILQMAKWEKREHIKADYYFIPVKEECNADYTLNSRRLAKKIRTIHNLGHEIGYHAGFYTADHPDLCCHEVKRLRNALGENNPVLGSRQHYLKNRMPDTFLALEQQGILYDTTLAFADMEGFRCGTCHPFRHYDICSRREMELWEIPIIFMDVTLKVYQKYSTTILEEKFKQYYRSIEKYGGVLTILWHNNRFAEEEWRNYNRIYCSYVKFLVQKLQSCNGREIIEEYRKAEEYYG